MREFRVEPIGVVHSPIKRNSDAPIQPKFSDFEGQIEVFPKFSAGLTDVDGYSHITVIFVFDRCSDYELMIYPYMGDSKRGVFATRSPYRPNFLGISVLGVKSVEGNIIEVAGLDILDGTPVVDIKPYVAGFARKGEDIKTGWLGDHPEKTDGIKSEHDRKNER
jgi:tRNA-Thr(GGU) m(6)t(6)A37 methyltransferase TsaA